MSSVEVVATGATVNVEVMERAVRSGHAGEYEIARGKLPYVPAVGQRIAFKDGSVHEVTEVVWWPEYEWTVEVFTLKIEDASRPAR